MEGISGLEWLRGCSCCSGGHGLLVTQCIDEIGASLWRPKVRFREVPTQ